MEREKKPKHFIHQPAYPGGNKAFTDFIYSHLKYPKLAADAKLEGVVVLRYDIDNQGVVQDVQVLKGIGLGCDEEAARVVKMLRFEVPKNRGLRVTFHKNVRIQFKMAKPVELPQPGIQQIAPTQINYSIVPTEKPAVPEEAKPANISYSITYNFG
jgi:protein TonB